jgi:hypothetical protein
MKNSAARWTGARGTALLLRHSESWTREVGRSGYARLEDAVGEELARMLVAALAPRGRDRIAA